MRQEDILELLRRRPFQSFRIFVSDGTTYDIHHPDQILVERSKATIVTVHGTSSFQAEEIYEQVALLHITRVRPLSQPTTNEN